MSAFSVVVRTLATGNPVLVPAGLDFRPSNWSAVAKGGMWDAEIEVRGPLDELAGLTSWLGYTLEIVNDRGTPVWWGDIVTVEIVAGGLRKGISLDRMANRVMLRYSETQPGGGVAAVDTGWSDNTLSQAAYGIYERRITPERALTATESTTMRATALNTLSAPHYTLALDTGPAAARLYCTGFWQRGKRSYYSQAAGLEEHNVSGSAYPLGLGIVASGSVAFSGRAKSITELVGRCKNFPSDWSVKVTGAAQAGNNTTFAITGVDDRDPISYSSSAVTFSAADDISDANGGLAFIENDDVLYIDGSAANTGSHIMSKAGSVNVEVSGGLGVASITGESAGPTITFYRGNAINVTPTPTNEGAGNAITVTAWGQRYYQTFTLSTDAGSWTVASVEIRLCRVGGPVDNVKIELYTDSGGSPNTLLKSAQVAADDIPLSMDWVSFTFDNLQSLAYGTTYGLVVSRTGANDWDDFYQVDLDEGATYTGGACKAYDGAAYQTLSPAADLIFRVLGGVDTATQIDQMLDSWALNTVSAASGVVSCQYRNGDLTAYDELEALLDMGDDDGVRLLAATTAGRGVILYPKPNAIAARYAWQAGDRLTDLYGQDVEPGYLPAGEWVKIGDASSLGPWAALSPVFVERAEYDAGSGWNLEPEGAADPFDTGTKQG